MITPPRTWRPIRRASHILALGGALIFASAAATPASLGVATRARSPIDAQERQDPLAPIAALVVGDLLELAEWCQSERLLASRLTFYDAVLAWDPDHADARRILGWRRGGDGEWARSRPPRSTRDRAGLEDELAARRAALVERALDACDDRADELGPVGLRSAHVRLVAAAPDHAELRAALGQAQRADGTWARADAVLAVQRAVARFAAVAAAREAAPEPERLQQDALDDEVSRVAIPWTSVARTPGALVAGTIHFAEAKSIASAVDLVPAMMRAALPELPVPLADPEGRFPVGDRNTGEPQWWNQPRFYVVQAGRDRDALVMALAAERPERDRQLLRKIATGFLDAENSIGIWTMRPQDRLEAAVRQRVGLYLTRTYGVSAERGWIWEGIGLALSSVVTGTKNLVYVKLQPSDRSVAGGTDKPVDWQLFGAQADWLTMARDLLTQRRQFPLGILLGKSVNTMDKEDLLVAHALGIWLMDGHPELAPRVLARIGAGEASAAVLESETGLTLPAILDSLIEWLGDVRRAP